MADTIFDRPFFSPATAEILFISILGGAAGNAMYSWSTTEADWIGEQRAEIAVVVLALISGMVMLGSTVAKTLPK